ncbi:MAG TPA: hypothetical protein VFZ64_04800 [Nocardioidaceae bacterium]
MNTTGRTVPTSQGHVSPGLSAATATGFVSGTLRGGRTAPTPCLRLAAAASLLLGVTLLLVVPDLGGAAPYVAVLAGAAAVSTIGAGLVLCRSVDLVARTVTAFAASGLLIGGVLQVSVGLPGVRELPHLSLLEGSLALGLALAVLGFLLVDALRRRPDQPADHPYAL